MINTNIQTAHQVEWVIAQSDTNIQDRLLEHVNIWPVAKILNKVEQVNVGSYNRCFTVDQVFINIKLKALHFSHFCNK